jgi:TfoX/Sxy family transcriptional regulator of competence genes
MGTSKDTIAYVLEQLEPLDVRAHAMFGEYCVYCDEKVVAFVCDDTFFLKPSSAAPGLGIHLVPAPPYPGAKDYFVIGDVIVGDDEEFRRVVQATADALPAPKPKRRSRAR